MRYISRVDLDLTQIKYLNKQQQILKEIAIPFDSTSFWKNRYETIKSKGFLQKLFSMAGNRKRCMYCMDSKGSDIEHFHPKSLPPFDKMFQWKNWLLCCTDCGRNKGVQFPIDKEELPLLIDPTIENPWLFLDLDVNDTWGLIGRHDLSRDAISLKGQTTVTVLLLDREDLNKGYKKTWKRLVKIVEDFLHTPYEESEFIEVLLDDDDHHLLGWCFHGTGENESPFSELKQQHPEIWQRFVNHPELLIPATQEKL
ncbi:MAG: hypothetical protein RLZZ156_1482 [Deinococcota bacterium]|jgi:uncharacterized protein (TIGR02646 family)